MSEQKTKRRLPALFNYGGASITSERSAEFYRKYPDCPRPEPLDRLALPLKREYAEAIIAGTKPVEFRECKPHYGNRIFDKAVMHWRDLHDADPSITDEDFACADPIRPVRTIHFYDYNGTWFLDVAIKKTGLITITDVDIQMLQDRFACHDYDAEPARLAAIGIPENERPLLFYFAVDKVIDSNLR